MFALKCGGFIPSFGAPTAAIRLGRWLTVLYLVFSDGTQIKFCACAYMLNLISLFGSSFWILSAADATLSSDATMSLLWGANDTYFPYCDLALCVYLFLFFFSLVFPAKKSLINNYIGVVWKAKSKWKCWKLYTCQVTKSSVWNNWEQVEQPR